MGVRRQNQGCFPLAREKKKGEPSRWPAMTPAIGGVGGKDLNDSLWRSVWWWPVEWRLRLGRGRGHGSGFLPFRGGNHASRGMNCTNEEFWRTPNEFLLGLRGLGLGRVCLFFLSPSNAIYTLSVEAHYLSANKDDWAWIGYFGLHLRFQPCTSNPFLQKKRGVWAWPLGCGFCACHRATLFAPPFPFCKQ